MTTDDIADRVRNIIADVVCVEVEKMTDASSLGDDLGADSLDDVEILMAIEDEFNLVIADDEVKAALTVGDAIKLVRGKVAL